MLLLMFKFIKTNATIVRITAWRVLKCTAFIVYSPAQPDVSVYGAAVETKQQRKSKESCLSQ